VGLDPGRVERSPRASLLFACFLLSGATGLVYEIVWLRQLGLIFGHTVHAITAVLAAFMGGLGLGSAIFGRRAARIWNLISAYGWLEIGIGVYAAFLPSLLVGAADVYHALYGALGLSYGAFTLVQFLVLFALLLIPTTLMGGTLPILSQALMTEGRLAGRLVGGLYAFNTVGAVAGAALAGYLLLPSFGNRAVTLAAAATNIGVGAVALVYSRTRRSGTIATLVPASDDHGTEAAPPLGRTGYGARPWLVMAGLGVSGAVSMVYEVAWTRALALVIGSSTYAFTAILVAFLTGIAGGSALYAWLWGRRPGSSMGFAGIQAAIGLATLGILLVFERAPYLFLLGLWWSDSPRFVQFVQILVSAGALLVATVLIGATFPCGVAVAAPDADRTGRAVGHLYAVNALGAIAGTVLAGFVLLPTLGVHASLKAGIIANLLLAGTLFASGPGPATIRRWAGPVASLAGAVGVAVVPSWNPLVMVSGPAIYGKVYLAAENWRGLIGTRDELLFYRDGLSSTVSVHRRGDGIFLRVNGKTDASASTSPDTVDLATQLMSGHLPLFLHPDPRAVLVIGLGSGLTVGAVARHPVERIDVVEIESAVVEASRFFALWHGDVLKDPRVRTVIADGRNFLLTTPARYDVIISEPSNPWIGGLASLFSVEFFQGARARLQPGGIMLQWLQGYNLAPEDFRMVVRTFRTVFPATSLWFVRGGDYLLLGQSEARPLDLRLIGSRFRQNPALRSDLTQIRIESWAGLLSFFVLAAPDVARLAERAGLNTDDRLPLEFSAPRALYDDKSARNWQMVRDSRTRRLPDVTLDSRAELERAEVRYAIGLGYLRRDEPNEALADFSRALELDPAHVPAMVGTGWVHLGLSQPAPALELATKALAHKSDDLEALGLAAVASLALGKNAEAVTFLQRAWALNPGDSRIARAMSVAQQAMLQGTLPPILWKPYERTVEFLQPGL
jgi:spermidine synthase